MMMAFLSLVLAYVLGSIPFGYLLVKWRTGADIRTAGSRNTGATNVLRTTGLAAGIATLLLDIGKGYAAVWIADLASAGNPFWMSLAALAVMLGHTFPLFLGFKGGKAVASFLGAFLRLAPLATLAILIVFVGVVAWSRHISLGSIVAAGTLPLALWLIIKPPFIVLLVSIVAAVLIIYRHRANIERLNQGTEHVLTLGAHRR
ncbi:MAG: glycerol-3-phosphate 1-O-acyltransferase PlsY [Acidobacteriia bacterium]|nr:glycerol-3-phosphate 1-O-acyltransferase PlsY [Terriglobia bacterium]